MRKIPTQLSLIFRSFRPIILAFVMILTINLNAVAQCTCAGNLVQNPSFESGTTHWQWSGGTLSAGGGAVKCGAASGDFQISNTGSNWVSQTIGVDLPAGTVINASAWAGVHNNSLYHHLVIDFFDVNWNWISASTIEVNKVLSASPTGPQHYSWSGVVPVNCKYTSIGFSGNGDWIKTDQWCVTTAPATTVSFGNEVFVDTNGNGVKDGGDWGYDGATVKLYADNDDNGVADGGALATQTTSGGGQYNFTNLAPGKYFVQIENTPSWMFLVPKNGGDPDNNIDNDNNGLSKTGTTIKGGTITLSLGGEPNTNYNPTYDFAIYKNNGLGDFVFLDADADGVQDTGEQGIQGVTVNLKNTSGTTLATTTTDATGYYYFYDPAQYGTNNYNIQFITPSGYAASPANQGIDDTKDSDPVSGTITNVNVPNGVWNYTFDAGFTTLPCTGRVTSLYLNRLDGGTDLPITNGASFTTIQLGSAYNLEAATTGTVGSVKFAITGPVAGTNIENTAPYNSPATSGGGWAPTPGTYSVNIKTYSGSNASGTLCHDTTINIVVTAPECNCPGNILTNASFESGTTGWSWSGGNFSTGAGYQICGANGGFLQQTSGTAKVWQQLTAIPGNQYNVSAYLGTHTAGQSCSPKFYLNFYTSGGTLISSSPSPVNITTDVDVAPYLPQLYSISGIAPANAAFVRVEAWINCDYIKIDAVCMTTTPLLNLGNYVWYDRNTNGTQDAGEPAIAGATVRLYLDADGNNTPDGAAIATTTTDANGLYNFGPISANKYIVGVVLPAGYAGTVTTATSASPDNDNNTDNNGVTTVSGELRSNFITLATGTEPTTDGDGNNGNLTLDFGLKGTGSIGDFVWNDLNNNGVQDAGEPGIAGVTVTLTYPGGATVNTTTGANGEYLFSNLAPTAVGQSYTVTFATPAGYVASPSNQGGDDAKDSDPVSGVVNGITLTAGQSNLTIDAGFVSNQLNIGNFVWEDRNNNGVQDAGEPGIVGATVNLYRDADGNNVADGAAISTTTTIGGGIYNFSGLTPGNYIVGVVIPAGYSVAATTATSAAPNNDNNTDNNGVITASGEVRSNFLTITTTGEPNTAADGDGTNGNLTLDFGLKGTGSIGDFVWNDLDGDGVQDAGEPGIAGVTVTLTYPGGATVTTTTNSSGAYLFSNLAPTGVGQSYTVTFGTPAGFTATPANQGGDDAKDSDAVSGVVNGITLTAGQSNLTIDAGFYRLASLGDFVWEDNNANGVQDGGEPGINAVQVTLSGTTGAGAAVNQTTSTNASGAYSFTNLAPGTYTVTFGTPAGYVASPSNLGGDDTKDSDPVGGVVSGITLTSGQNNPTIDAGFYRLASLGDFVWNDTDGDGIQDAGETGINNVTVTLSGTTGAGAAVNQTTATNTSGAYSFNNLVPGTYTVTFATPAGTTPSPANQGGDDAKDSDPVGGIVSGITLVSGQSNQTIDAGFVTLMNLGNYVWYDVNNNGVQDASEPGIVGVAVKLYRDDITPDNIPDGPAIATTTTVAGGLYSFTGLTPGRYIVGITAPAGYAMAFTTLSSLTPDNNNNTDNNGITVIGTEITSNYITLSPATEPDVAADGDGTNGNLTLDFGLKGTGSIGDFVWNDLNNNGVQDAGEPGIAGVTVTLTYPGGATVNTTTVANGEYLFSNLAPTAVGQSYTVTFGTPAGYVASPSNQGGDDAKDSDPVSGVVNGITLTAGQSNLTIDAGFVSNQLNLGNYVWYDKNLNGLQDSGEPAIANATVRLYADADGNNVPDGPAIANTATNTNGIYGFSGLTPGNYIVGVVPPAGYAGTTTTATSASPNNDNNTDNNGVTVVSGELRSNFITLTTAGEPTTDGDGNNGNLTLDFGLKATGSIGDFVWQDLNNNGLQDGGEPGIQNVTVVLRDGTGTVVATTTTNSSGGYLFPNLIPGTYSVTFTTPAGYIPATSNAGGNDAIDSDPIGGVVSGIVLTAGQNNLTIDAGFRKLIRVTGNVWHDVNAMADGFVNNTGPLSTPPASLIPGSMFAFLVDDVTGLIVQVTDIDALNGTFAFEDVTPNTDYRVVISTLYQDPGFAVPLSVLPSGWIHTGQNFGLIPGDDGFNDGMLFFSVDDQDVDNVNFGIRRRGRDIVIG